MTTEVSVMTPGNTQPFDMASFRESLALAEIQAKAATEVGGSLHRRPVRKHSSSEHNYVPPRQLLMYLVRMGSFTSVPKVTATESQDQDLEFPVSKKDELLQRCRRELSQLPPPLTRSLKKAAGAASPQHTDTQLDVVPSDVIRVLQWNHLSQTLGTQNDKFVKSSATALDWRTRRWRLLEELLMYNADIVCLQEVDHFDFIDRALTSVGYCGSFVAKPDSPCIYLPENNGPDGCAIFYKRQKFEMINSEKRVLEVWKVQSNQVVMLMNLRIKNGSGEICVSTTHLKARTGALLSTLRNEQGKDLLQWINKKRESRPLILTGDFNAEPTEPVYKTLTGSNLSSAYREEGQEPRFTTWKIREDGEYKQTLDYVFHSPSLEVTATLQFPTEEQIGPDRLPCPQFASDHLSLLADFRIMNEASLVAA